MSCLFSAESIRKIRDVRLSLSKLSIPRPKNTVVREISEKIRNPVICASLRDALQVTNCVSQHRNNVDRYGTGGTVAGREVVAT